jgi:hypothetical protein
LIVGLVESGLRYITGNPLDPKLGISLSEWVVLMLFNFFAQSAVYAVLLKYPDSGAIGLGKGMLVSLIQTILSIVIGIAIALLFLVLVFIAALIFGGG